VKILVTNDDGIFAQGLWILVQKLKSIAEVIVVAPDREQSAIGTAVTLFQPLRIQGIKPMIPDVETYSVEGTPSDCVILALSKLVKNQIDLVVSGINQGLNLGNDVLISGTVGAALQGYLHGSPALALSTGSMNGSYLENAAKLAALLAKKIDANILPANIFLNVNLPDLPLAKVKEIKITQLASESHTDIVEEGHDGKRPYYRLVRQKINKNTNEQTDIRTIEQGSISITPLHTDLPGEPSSAITDSLFSGFLRELQRWKA